jgi:hypothetical protein
LALTRQAQLIRRDLRVLLTTGYSGLETPGAEEFSMIQKPPTDLGRVVAQILATK